MLPRCLFPGSLYAALPVALLALINVITLVLRRACVVCTASCTLATHVHTHMLHVYGCKVSCVAAMLPHGSPHLQSHMAEHP